MNVILLTENILVKLNELVLNLKNISKNELSFYSIELKNESSTKFGEEFKIKEKTGDLENFLSNFLDILLKLNNLKSEIRKINEDLNKNLDKLNNNLQNLLKNKDKVDVNKLQQIKYLISKINEYKTYFDHLLK